jgi:hypothetical protein
MRQTIESAPRDGSLVILVDDASGTYDVAHWSPEAGQWIGENGEPSKVTPSHWYPMPAERYLQQRDGLPSGLRDASTSARQARRHGFFPLFAIGATLVAAALIGLCFHAEVVAYVARYAGQQTILGPPVMAQQIPLPKEEEAAQFKRAVDSATADLRQSLQQEHDWTEALATELVNRRRDVDMLLGALETLLTEHKINEAERLKQAVDSATADLRQSLQREHDRAEALATEMANARRAMDQKPAAVEEKSGVSLAAWANSNAFVNPSQIAVEPDVATGTSKWASKPVGPARVEHEPRGGYGCQPFRTLALSRLSTNDWLTCWMFGPTIAMPSRRPQHTRRPTLSRNDMGVRPNQRASANGSALR